MKPSYILRTALLGLLIASSGAFAQTSPVNPAQPFPTQTVRIVVPVSAGSTADILARTLAEKLTQVWNQPVIVENRPGIAGIASVAKAAADGYTVMLTANGHVATGSSTRASLSIPPRISSVSPKSL